VTGDWGLGTGDWGLGTGDWGLGTGDWDLKEIVEFAQKHDLWLIEDNCDALGSLYQGKLAS
ncbi:DegT/DnrJ/EryC1/StrS family aminotransferase, partial [Sphaerospermopsis sp. FACHB-1094]|uniref:DegT/DnrJ/EryC1/StrS family aminotransferase n=1 Tax=Sphaerospermopsis sp. FACHB-1094 TaxID=2692861 RepID=UPI001689B3A7